MASVVASKGSNIIGSGANLMPQMKSYQSGNAITVCANARAAVVEKQFGADPTLPGPGQYIDPLTDGRNANGEVKSLLSTQKSQPSVKFAGPDGAPLGGDGRSMAKPNSRNEPGPGQYINPITNGRGPDGECKAVLSTQKATTSTVWFRPGASRDVFASGGLGVPGPGAYLDPKTLDRGPNGEVKVVLSTMRGASSAAMGRPRSVTALERKPSALAVSRRADHTPGPGHYIDPLKEGRNADGEIKALLSNQTSVRTIRFGARPSSAGNFRSMAKPNSRNEPGPGQYIDPMKEGRAADGSVRAVQSNQRQPGRAVFAGKPYEPPGGGGGSSGQRRGGRPSSAPAARGRRGGQGAPLYDLSGDVKVLSKYKNTGAARWGPPGR